MSVDLSPCRELPSQEEIAPQPPLSSVSTEEKLDRFIYGPDAHPSGFSILAGEWNDLLAHSRFDTIFMTYEWQTTWWRELGQGELWILAFREPAQGTLVGIAPLFLARMDTDRQPDALVFHVVGCTEVSDYIDVIVRRGYEGQVYTSLCAWLQSEEAPAWDVFDLCNLPEDSLSYTLLPRIAEACGLEAEVRQEDVAPYIPLPRRYEEYLAQQVEKKQRHEIRRKQRRVEREATPHFYLVGPEHDLQQELTDFIALQQMSDPEKEAFMTPAMQRYFRTLARRMYDADYLRLAFLTLNGKKAAALFAFEYKGKLLLYNSGYDTGELAQYSPGWVLLAYMIQYAIAVGLRVFDFLQGDEEYKYRFGSQDYRVMRTLMYKT
ncbi:MAG: GNAT family N-acetyltransferase [Caldilineae bacterium]|nr:MAG: GNAT family N-acetyltransferase [Caldilineae bacterium]